MFSGIKVVFLVPMREQCHYVGYIYMNKYKDSDDCYGTISIQVSSGLDMGLTDISDKNPFRSTGNNEENLRAALQAKN